MSQSTTDARRRRGRVIGIVLALVVLLGGGYVGARAVAGDKVPRGTTVAGVDLGGLSPQAAEEALAAGLRGRVDEPITVEVSGETTEVDPAEAGLAVDYAATVREAGGGDDSWGPGRVVGYFVGAGDTDDVVVTVDDRALRRVAQELSGSVAVAPVDGTVEIVDGEIEVGDPQTGEGVDPAVLGPALADAFLSEQTVAAEVTDVEPAIDAADVEAAVAEAETALAAPVVLRFGDNPVRLRPAAFGDALSFRPRGGALEATLDEDVLAGLVDDATTDGEPVDARIELVDGRPRVIPAKPGLTFEPADVVAAFTSVLDRPRGEREADVDGTVTQPDLTTADARALGVRRKVSEFETYYPPTEYRDINIGRAAELINGTLLLPGETFSLNDTTGERTAENGFTVGGVISGGVFRLDYGGGVSQMATTTFNAAFFAGLEDVEHQPHSVYISRYPEGREATVDFGNIDLRFRNDTDHGVLIEAEVIPSAGRPEGTVRVAMWSTKTWDIESVTGERYAFTSPGTTTIDAPDCQAGSGSGGFSVDVTRVFRRPGEDEVVRREPFTTVYNPLPTVICE